MIVILSKKSESDFKFFQHSYLFKLWALVNCLFEFIQHNPVCVDVPALRFQIFCYIEIKTNWIAKKSLWAHFSFKSSPSIMLHGVLVEVFQDHVPYFPIVALNIKKYPHKHNLNIFVNFKLNISKQRCIIVRLLITWSQPGDVRCHVPPMWPCVALCPWEISFDLFIDLFIGLFISLYNHLCSHVLLNILGRFNPTKQKW